MMKARRRFKTSKLQRDLTKKRNRKYRDTPQGVYVTARVNAGRRGIEWQFTFESWWRLWEKSGKFALRGRRYGAYVMARLGDSGPYAPYNCEIVLNTINSQAAAVSAGIVDPASVPEACDYARQYC
jgi:hypothetical protein